MKCPHCGADMYDYQTMCLNCGEKVKEDTVVVEHEVELPTNTVKVIAPGKKFTAALLAVAFGYLGAHCFYLGQKKKAIVKIITSIFIIPVSTILTFIDVIKIIKGSYICDPNAVF